MVLLIDADSLIFASCYKPRKYATDSLYYETLDECRTKFDEQLMKITTTLEEQFQVTDIRVFNGRSRNNFRKLITKKYKANRTAPKPPMLNEMHSYVKQQYASIQSCGHETDDAVAKYWYETQKIVGRDNVMIVSIDKDYKQFPALIYNYHPKHKKILNISYQEALFNFYEQMIVGDTADNVNYFYGKGKVFAGNYLKNCKTKYQYTKKLLNLFKQTYKGKAKQKFAECYHLLKLRTDV